MRLSWIPIGVALVVLSSGCQPAEETPPMEEAVEAPAETTTEMTDEEELQALTDEFERAWGASDAQALGAIYTEDGDFIDPAGRLFEGREAIVARYETVFQGVFQGTNISIDQTSVRMLGDDVAVARGTYEITGMQSAEGEDMPAMEGMYTNVAVLENGEWKIESSRAMVPVQPPAEGT